MRTTAIAPLLLLAFLLWGSYAGALTLGDLQGGDSFSSLNGRLFFSDFDVVASPGLPVQDLDDYIVTPLAEGFGITLAEGAGPLEVTSPQAGDLLIAYRVDATSHPIEAASLLLDGAATGEGAFSAVSEDFLAVPEDGGAFLDDLLALVTGEGSSQLGDAAVLAPVVRMNVIKDIQLSAAAGVSASVDGVEQHFMTPEPSTFLCVGTGLMGLAFGGRRRQPIR